MELQSAVTYDIIQKFMADLQRLMLGMHHQSRAAIQLPKPFTRSHDLLTLLNIRFSLLFLCFAIIQT
jgi:hypothetical protein